MRSITLIATALLAFCGSAFAADMASKAPDYQVAYPYAGGSGPYFGINVMAGVQETNANSTLAGGLATGNLNAAGGSVGGTIGYIWGSKSSPVRVALEASGDWQNVTASATTIPTVGATVASRWSSEQVVKLFGFNPLTYLAALGLQDPFPTFPQPSSIPGFAAGSLSATPQLYFGAGVKEYGISGNFFQAGGASVGIAGLLQTGYIFQLLNPTTGVSVGGVVDVGAELVLGGKTVQISNALSSTGPAAVGTINVGNGLFGYTKVLF